jgi:phospholipid/cholesterol/gamma-HCH transport system substrate-binding protein
MQMIKPEVKVGAFTLIALAGMFGLALWLNGFQLFQRGNDVEAEFSRVEGLRPGAPVKYAGVDIGRVNKVYFENFKVIVGMRINPDFKVPKNAKAIIASSGVVGDMFVEILLPKPGDPVIPRKNGRLAGQTPVTMDQFYAMAYEVLYSLEQITYSIKSITDNQEVMNSIKTSLIRLNTITSDIASVTGQLKQIDLVEMFQKIDHTMTIVERLAVDNEPQINKMLQNITLASAQLSQASITANEFLKKLDNNGQTAADLRETLSQAKKISENLEKFSEILASKGDDIDLIIGDARKTLQSINEVAQNINKAVCELTRGDDSSIVQVKKIIADTSQATEKITQSVDNLTKIAITGRVGLEYQPEQPVMADTLLDLSFNPQNSLYFGVEDIGNANLATLQWAAKGPVTTSRVGLYRNQFGIGLDLKASPGLNFGLDLWNTHTPNFGVTSRFNVTNNWSLSLGGSSDFSTQTFTWSLGGWYGF